MDILSIKKVNTGRQLEIDLLKAVCISFMVLIHVFGDCVSTENSIGGGIDDVAGCIVGAASFMICMGIGMRYARRQSAKDYVIRGAAILTVGQLLNLLRNALPNLIGYWITGKQWFIANSLLVIQADILSFAGLAFFAIAVFRKLRLSDLNILIVSFVMNIAGWGIVFFLPLPKNYLVNQLLGYFIVTKAESYFPLMSYLIFVATGFFIGGKYPYIKSKEKLSNLVLLICFPICLMYYLIRFNVKIPYMPEFSSDLNYSLYPGPDAVASVFASLVLIALFYKIIKKAGGLHPVFSHLSENINSYYCVSFVIIMSIQSFMIGAYGHLLPGEVPGLLATAVILIVCAVIIELNKKYIHFSVVGLSRMKGGAAVFASIWILTLLVVVYAYPKIDEFANIWNEYLLP